jgi:hypothetical protein
MKQYLLSIYQPDGDPPPPDVLAEITRDLHTATVIHPRREGMPMTDGPYVEGKEHIGGLNIIRAANLDEALEWGRKLARATTLPIEVRPFQGELDD